MAIRNYLYEDFWQIGIIDKPISEILTDEFFFKDIQLIPSPKNGFYADPFWNLSDNNPMIYCEKFDFSKQKGEIIKVNTNGEEWPVLENETHFSFPNVCPINNGLLIPENADSGSLNAYDLDGKKLFKMMNQPIIDPVIYPSNKYWLFCSIFDKHENEELHLFTSDSPEHWHSHPFNPIVKTKNGARMAGQILEVNGDIYRFGQNCEQTYGGGISIFKIEELSEKSYQEVFVKSISAPEPFVGVHSINPYKNQTLVDFKSEIFSMKKPFQRLKKKFS